MARLALSVRARARVAASLVAALVALPSFAPGVAFAQAAPDAKTSLANGNKAAGAKEWAKALAEFEASNRAAPSADAQEGVANALYQLKRDGEAHAAYTAWDKAYGAKAPPAKKTAVAARLKELEGRTGALVLELTGVPEGVVIAVDDKPVDRPAPGTPLRLAAGPHRVKVTKDGFLPFEQSPHVTAGASTNLAVKLEAQSGKGRLSVKEKSGKAVRVVVDGVDVGDAPWVGELDAGNHDVFVRAAGIASAPEKVSVERGKTRDLELSASSTTATLKITTSDGKGLIYIDGKLVGEGTFASEIPAGQHALRITRDGYDAFEEQIELKDKDTIARSITLNLASTVVAGEVQGEKTRLEGVYGGFNLLYTFLPSGMSHTMEKTCNSDIIAPGNPDAQRPSSLAGCEGVGGSSGGGLTGFIGYHWDPIGVELFLGGQYDQSSPTLTWAQADLDPGFGPNPARTEEYAVRRLGGFGAARIRLTLQTDKIRFSMAAGVGLSYRVMLMERDTRSTANPELRDVFVPDSQSYLSPILSVEPSVYYRLGQHTSIGLGLTLLVESPRAFDQTPTTNREQGHRLGLNGLDTPSYELASSTQIFFGPFVGMMFGP